MKVLVLGCGEMGKVAISDCYRNCNVDEILVCVKDTSKAIKNIQWVKNVGNKIKFKSLDISSCGYLSELFSKYNVIINCAGPNYKYEILVAKAAIEAGVDVVDLNDDYETTLAMFDLDEAAKNAGISIIMGLGASPGVNNVLVRSGVDELDKVKEIHTSWVMSAADPGGLALSYHLLHSLSGKALTIENGNLIEVDSFKDGKERINFPLPVGPMDVYHVGHPEPITLFRKYNNVKHIDNKASFNPPYINDLIVNYGKKIKNNCDSLKSSIKNEEPIDVAAKQLLMACKEVNNISKDGALRVEVKGEKDGKGLKIIYSATGRITYGTGIPSAIGAQMLLSGKINQKGILTPEECIDPEDFIEEINKRGIGDIDEERINY